MAVNPFENSNPQPKRTSTGAPESFEQKKGGPDPNEAARIALQAEANSNRFAAQSPVQRNLFRDAQNLTNRLFPSSNELLGGGAEAGRKKGTDTGMSSDGQGQSTRRNKSLYNPQNPADDRRAGTNTDTANTLNVNDKKFAAGQAQPDGAAGSDRGKVGHHGQRNPHAPENTNTHHIHDHKLGHSSRTTTHRIEHSGVKRGRDDTVLASATESVEPTENSTGNQAADTAQANKGQQDKRQSQEKGVTGVNAENQPRGSNKQGPQLGTNALVASVRNPLKNASSPLAAAASSNTQTGAAPTHTAGVSGSGSQQLEAPDAFSSDRLALSSPGTNFSSEGAPHLIQASYTPGEQNGSADEQHKGNSLESNTASPLAQNPAANPFQNQPRSLARPSVEGGLQPGTVQHVADSASEQHAQPITRLDASGGPEQSVRSAAPGLVGDSGHGQEVQSTKRRTSTTPEQDTAVEQHPNTSSADLASSEHDLTRSTTQLAKVASAPTSPEQDLARTTTHVAATESQPDLHPSTIHVAGTAPEQDLARSTTRVASVATPQDVHAFTAQQTVKALPRHDAHVIATHQAAKASPGQDAHPPANQQITKAVPGLDANSLTNHQITSTFPGQDARTLSTQQKAQPGQDARTLSNQQATHPTTKELSTIATTAGARGVDASAAQKPLAKASEAKTVGSAVAKPGAARSIDGKQITVADKAVTTTTSKGMAVRGSVQSIASKPTTSRELTTAQARTVSQGRIETAATIFGAQTSVESVHSTVPGSPASASSKATTKSEATEASPDAATKTATKSTNPITSGLSNVSQTESSAAKSQPTNNPATAHTRTRQPITTARAISSLPGLKISQVSNPAPGRLTSTGHNQTVYLNGSTTTGSAPEKIQVATTGHGVTVTDTSPNGQDQVSIKFNSPLSGGGRVEFIPGTVGSGAAASSGTALETAAKQGSPTSTVASIPLGPNGASVNLTDTVKNGTNNLGVDLRIPVGNGTVDINLGGANGGTAAPAHDGTGTTANRGTATPAHGETGKAANSGTGAPAHGDISAGSSGIGATIPLGNSGLGLSIGTNGNELGIGLSIPGLGTIGFNLGSGDGSSSPGSIPVSINPGSTSILGNPTGGNTGIPRTPTETNPGSPSGINPLIPTSPYSGDSGSPTPTESNPNPAGSSGFPTDPGSTGSGIGNPSDLSGADPGSGGFDNPTYNPPGSVGDPTGGDPLDSTPGGDPGLPGDVGAQPGSTPTDPGTLTGGVQYDDTPDPASAANPNGAPGGLTDSGMQGDPSMAGTGSPSDGSYTGSTGPYATDPGVAPDGSTYYDPVTGQQIPADVDPASAYAGSDPSQTGSFEAGNFGPNNIGPNGTLIGQDGSPMIGPNGSLIGPDGSPLVGPNGGLIGPDGSPLVGPNGGLIGPDGSPLVGANGSTIGQDGTPLNGQDGNYSPHHGQSGSGDGWSGAAGALSDDYMPWMADASSQTSSGGFDTKDYVPSDDSSTDGSWLADNSGDLSGAFGNWTKGHHNSMDAPREHHKHMDGTHLGFSLNRQDPDSSISQTNEALRLEAQARKELVDREQQQENERLLALMQREEKERRERDEKIARHNAELDATQKQNDKDQSKTLLALLLAEEQRVKEENKQELHKVQEGETLEQIALDRLNDATLAPLIYQLNKSKIKLEYEEEKPVYELTPGTILTLPSKRQVREYKRQQALSRSYANDPNAAQMSEAARKEAAQRRANIEKYLGPITPAINLVEPTARPRLNVRLGDTLRSIAIKHPVLQDVSLWRLLAQVNGLSTDTDNKGTPIAQLRRGTTLAIPTAGEIANYKQSLQEGRAPAAPLRPYTPTAPLNVISGNKGPHTLNVRAENLDVIEQKWVQDTMIDSLIEKLGDACRVVKSNGNGAPSIRSQLEVLTGDNWVPILTYEICDHASVRHEIRPDGTRRTIPLDLPAATVEEMMSTDIHSNWQAYAKKYLRQKTS
jgi:hypothetical protein